MTDAFRLELQVRLQKVEYDPADVERRYPRWTNTSLSVQQSDDLGALSFAQVANVLSRFYEVAEAIKAEMGTGASESPPETERMESP